MEQRFGLRKAQQLIWASDWEIEIAKQEYIVDGR